MGWCLGRNSLAVAVLMMGATVSLPAAIAQPGSVMQIPVPAPQARGGAIGEGGADFSNGASLPTPAGREVLAGEPLAMPGETVPVGSWAGRAGVKEIALAEMPWMGGGGYGYGYGGTVVAQAQYRVVVATPSEAHADALQQVMPEAIALDNPAMMQAGAFADWRRANALRRALGAYGFVVEIQGM